MGLIFLNEKKNFFKLKFKIIDDYYMTLLLLHDTKYLYGTNDHEKFQYPSPVPVTFLNKILQS